MESKYRGALFDLDGVLIDSEGRYTEFWSAVGRRYGVPSPTFAADIKGSTLKEILATHFADEATRLAVLEDIHRFEDEIRYDLFPGVEAFVRDLRDRLGVKTAIVTSSDDVKMGYLFTQHPEMREWFDAVVDGSMVKCSKPDPEGYLLAAQLIGVPIGECIVFEDSLQGLEAGRRSGAGVVALATTNPRAAVEPLADATIDSFEGKTFDALLK